MSENVGVVFVPDLWLVAAPCVPKGFRAVNECVGVTGPSSRFESLTVGTSHLNTIYIQPEKPM